MHKPATVDGYFPGARHDVLFFSSCLGCPGSLLTAARATVALLFLFGILRF